MENEINTPNLQGQNPQIVNVDSVKKRNKTKVFVVLLFLLLIVLVLAGLYFFNKRKNTEVVNQSTNTNTSTSKASELPDWFPKEFLNLEPDTEIIRDLTSETSGSLQGSREFYSSKDIDSAYDFYKKQFSDKGWKVMEYTGSNTKTSKTFMALKGEMSATFNAKAAQVDNKVVVSLNFYKK